MSKGDRCSFRHESDDRAQKPDHKAATLSDPSMSRGQSVSKKRSIQGKSNHGATLRQQCRYYLKGTCMRSPCEYWHPPECQFYKQKRAAKPGISVCSRIINKVEEQPNKKTKKGYYSHNRRETDDKNAVAIVKIVPPIGLRLARLGRIGGFLKRKTAPVKPDAKSFGINSTSTIHTVNAPSSNFRRK